MKDKVQKIGVFDSGVGGLSVLQELVQHHPAEYIYLADTANLPYGEKSKVVLEQLTQQAISFLVAQKVDAVVIACHTASANAGDHVRTQFPALPIFDVVTPVVHEALKVTKNNRIGVMGTQATIMSQIHRKKILDINPTADVILQACPRLVPLIEAGLKDREELFSALEKYLMPIKAYGCDSLIIGCTHYELIKDHIQTIAGDIKLISAPQSTRALMEVHSADNKTSSVTCYVTEDAVSFKINAKLIAGLELENVSEVTLAAQTSFSSRTMRTSTPTK